MSTISRWTFWIQVCYCSGYRYKWRQSYIITITTLSIGFVPLCIFFLGTFFFCLTLVPGLNGYRKERIKSCQVCV